MKMMEYPKKCLTFSNACSEYGKNQTNEEINKLKNEILAFEKIKKHYEIGNNEIDFLIDCVDAGKDSCATGEWLNYPENKPEINNEYIFEFKHNFYDTTQKMAFKYETGKIIKDQNNIGMELKRFAKIK